MSEIPSWLMADADRERPDDRSYRIGLCAAKSTGRSGEDAEQFAAKVQRGLIMSPVDSTGTVEGVVLGVTAARMAAFRTHFTPNKLFYYALVAVTIVIAVIEDNSWLLIGLTIAAGAVIAMDLYALLEWQGTAPDLLESLPSTGTPIATSSAGLVIGDATIPYAEIRIAQIQLQTDKRSKTPDLDYFLDHATLTARGKTIHLDAAAIRNGQSIIDTLCSRVPLTAFSDDVATRLPEA